MTRPHGLLRAGFPYLKTLGYSLRIMFPTDIAITRDGRIFTLGLGSNYGKGKSGPVAITNLNDDDLGSFGWNASQMRKPEDLPVSNFSFLWPSALVLDSDEVLYASDEGCHRISRFTTDGEYLGKWGEHGSGDGQISRPSGMAFDCDDNLLVVDSNNHRVQRFSKDGRFLSKFGSYGTGDGQFDTPWGIAVDGDGDIYVSDWRNDRIQKFTADGEFIFKFGDSGSDDGELNRPAGVEVDKHGDIYVADWGNDRVQLFDHGGRFVQMFLGDATLSRSRLGRLQNGAGRYLRIREMGSLELEKRFAGPRSVRVDDEGHMYVADYDCYRIQVYKKEAYPLGEELIAPPLRAPTLNPN